MAGSKVGVGLSGVEELGLVGVGAAGVAGKGVAKLQAESSKMANTNKIQLVFFILLLRLYNIYYYYCIYPKLRDY
jgi:hypothetical protein